MSFTLFFNAPSGPIAKNVHWTFSERFVLLLRGVRGVFFEDAWKDQDENKDEDEDEDKDEDKDSDEDSKTEKEKIFIFVIAKIKIKRIFDAS